MATVKSTVRQINKPPKPPHYVPLRDHQIVTDDDGTQALVCFGVVRAVKLPPYGDVVLPPSWESFPRAVQVQLGQFIDLTGREIRRILSYSAKRVTVSAVPLPLPTAWLDAFGPDSEDPYLGEDHPLPFIGTDGSRYDALEAPSVPDDLHYCP